MSMHHINNDDLVKITASLVENRVEGPYVCLNPHGINYSEIAQAAFYNFNSKAIIHFLKVKAAILGDVFGRNDTLRQKIGFYSHVSVEDGVRLIALGRFA